MSPCPFKKFGEIVTSESVEFIFKSCVDFGVTTLPEIKYAAQIDFASV